mgnify:CR=1 FL=1
MKKKRPWNKGLHGAEYLAHFKNGFIPYNVGCHHTPEEIQKIKEGNKRWWDTHPEEKKLRRLLWIVDNPHKKGMFMGEKNNNWKGGACPVKYSKEFFEKRPKILARDEIICQLCMKEAGVVHHIDYNKQNNKENNLISLCKSCNGKVNKQRELWKEFFMYMKKICPNQHLFTKENTNIKNIGEYICGIL